MKRILIAIAAMLLVGFTVNSASADSCRYGGGYRGGYGGGFYGVRTPYNYGYRYGYGYRGPAYRYGGFYGSPYNYGRYYGRPGYYGRSGVSIRLNF